ncbi:hypothetical protein R3P38DRAFT_2521209 [Favolaschia claudopus]|uniref:Fungal-type protein kinase domain-containing protein n=1 Tax=Favolaschia claudopus TaxID=2862362 RepID=A0AAW0C1J8_9AGAR
MREVCRISGGSLPKQKRRWSGSYATQDSMPLGGSCYAQHPALVLFDVKVEDEAWATALSFAEVVYPDDGIIVSWLHRLIHGAADTFFNQDNRRFQLCLTFAARSVRFVLVDRCGVAGSLLYDIDEHPEVLVRLVAGLMFYNRPSIGFDTTITTLKNGDRQIKVRQDVYDIVKKLAMSQDVRGKATIVWHARRNGVDVVIKDNWTQPHDHVEAKVLEIAKDIPGIPKILAFETVLINRIEDSTSNLLDFRAREVRVHQRMVTTPLANRLSYFRSKKELISVLVDAIEAHRALADKNILHCDISCNNIMIADEEMGEPLRKGLLIDADSAQSIGDIGYWVGLVGTYTFMSSAILTRGSSVKQKPSDDLESFWWVLIYLCIRYAGPENTTRADYVATIKSFPPFDEDQTKADPTGRLKRHLLSAKGLVESEILPYFTLYFEDLKPCILELRDAFKRNKYKFSYDDMLDVLRRTRDALPLVENWSAQDNPVHRLERSPVESPPKRRRIANR